MKAKCFISFCTDDVLMKGLEELKRKLENQSKGRIDYLYYKEGGLGTNKYEFMKKIASCDSVIIICTSEYIKKMGIENKDVFFEFEEIKKRWEKIEKIKDKINNSFDNEEKTRLSNEFDNKNFEILPIIISDSNNKLEYEKVFPEYLKNKGFTYKRYTYIDSDTKKSLKELGGNIKDTEKRKNLQKLKDRINLVTDENSTLIIQCIIKTLRIRFNRTLDNQPDKLKKLTEITKAENIGNLGEAFCKTSFYEKIETQGKYIFIGRKGSGKTQALIKYERDNYDKYNGIIDIDVNNINLENILENILDAIKDIQIEKESFLHNEEKLNLTDSETRAAIKDIEYIFSYESLLFYVWIGYIYLFCIYLIACEKKRKELTSLQNNHFKNAFKFINELLDKIDDRFPNTKNREQVIKSISPSLFQYALDSGYKFFHNIIQNARAKYFYTDIHSANNLTNYINTLLGKAVKKSFTDTLNLCDKGFLLTLDGFDDFQDIHRGNRYKVKKISINDMNEFESLWLGSLFYTINYIKTDRSDFNILLDKIDACLMVPFDKCIQGAMFKRDGFVYRNSAFPLTWKGMELCNLFTKRLKIIAGVFGHYGNEHLDKLLEEHYRNIPKYINIKLLNGSCKMPLFLYILRYSFWRPRDIVDYIWEIFKPFINNENLQINTDSNENELMIKNIVSNCSEKITLSIVEEFKNIWNIKEFLDSFKDKKIILSYDELCEILKNEKNICFSNGKIISNTKEAIKYLYQLGIIGIIYSNDYAELYHTTIKQHFVFYSGQEPLKHLDNKRFEKNQIVINPTFISTLRLEVKTNEILGIPDWDTLRKIDNFFSYDHISKEIFDNFEPILKSV